MTDVTSAEIDKIKNSAEYKRTKKLLADREWRLDNLYWISDEDGNAIQFKRNDAQRSYYTKRWRRDVIAKARQLGYCQDPNMRVLTSDFKWVKLDDIQVGQEIICVDEFASGGKGSDRKMRYGFVEGKREVFSDAYRITLDSGVVLTATWEHRYMSKRRKGMPGRDKSWRGDNGKIQSTMWRPVSEMKVGDSIRNVTEPWGESSYEDGWFGGMLDGEGTMRVKPKGGFEIIVCQTPGAVLDRARKYLADRGYTFYETIDTRTHATAFGTRNKHLHKLIVHRTNEAYRILGQCRPSRFIDRKWIDGRSLPGKNSGVGWSTIVSIEKLPPQRMIDLQTSCKTFICEGVVSHNSTFIAILILDTCVFRSNTAAGIIDVTLSDAKLKLAKIKFAYDRLAPNIREACPLTKSNTEEMQWANGSSVRVGTSHRGGTLQILHISEYGKISVNSPDTAKEILTGALRAVHQNGWVAVESTAHGTAGEFHNMVQRATAKQIEGSPLTPLDYRMHFYGWWIKPQYRVPNNMVVVSQELREYFANIAPELQAKYGVRLDADQQAWYAQQYADLGPDDVKSEFPSIPSELFFNSLEGAYFKAEINKARGEGRIGQLVPFDPTRRVNTTWDIGEDMTAIWFHQSDGLRHRFIDYYEEEGGSLQIAVNVLDDKARTRRFVYDKHYGPHDLDNRDWANQAQSRYKTALDLGIKFTVVPRVAVKADAIEAARRMIGNSWYDAEHTSVGVERLENYRKKWNKTLGVFTSEPVHDIASHGADAKMQIAMGIVPDKVKVDRSRPTPERRTSAWAS